MKRDWKLIRAILCNEDESAWDMRVVMEHCALMVEADYTTSRFVRSLDGGIQVYNTKAAPLTLKGHDVAEKLRNASDLEDVLAMLDREGIGHIEEVVLALMVRKAKARLEKD